MKGNNIRLHLEHALFVPNSKFNLLSLSNLLDKGYSFDFNGTSSTLAAKGENYHLFAHENLFYFENLDAAKEVISNLSLSNWR